MYNNINTTRVVAYRDKALAGRVPGMGPLGAVVDVVHVARVASFKEREGVPG